MFKVGDYVLVLGVVAEVVPFVGVFFEVVEGGTCFFGKGEAVAVGDEAVAAFGTGVGDVVPVGIWGGGVVEEGGEAVAVELDGAGGGDACEVENSGVEVGVVDDVLGALAAFYAEGFDDEGGAHGDMVGGVFAPEAVVGEVVAVVAPGDDDGVVVEAFVFEGLDDFAHLGVYVAGAGHVATDEFLGGLVIDALVPAFVVVFGGDFFGVDDFFAAFGELGELAGVFGVEVEVFFGGGPGHVGTEEAAGDGEGFVGVAFCFEVGDDVVAGLTVVEEVVGAFGGEVGEGGGAVAGVEVLFDVVFASAVVNDSSDDFLGIGTAFFTGDVPGFFVGAGDAGVIDFATGRGPVARFAEDAGPGFLGFDEVGVAGPFAADGLAVKADAVEHGGTGGLAERVGDVVAVEADAVGGEGVEVGGDGFGFAVGFDEGAEVVEGEEEDVGLFGG